VLCVLCYDLHALDIKYRREIRNRFERERERERETERERERERDEEEL
jgi:hypothetical protein